MRFLLIAFTITVPVILGCIKKNDHHRTDVCISYEDTINAQHIDTFLVGDINGDKIRDTAFIIKPVLLDPNEIFSGCVDEKCDVTIYFSCKVKSIFYPENIGGKIFELPDLNKDGHAEILVMPAWFIGCWKNISVYSLIDDQWMVVGEIRTNTCKDDGEYNFAQRIRKKNKHSFVMIGDHLKEPEGIQVQYKKTFRF